MTYDFYVQKRSVSQKRKDLLASRLRAGDVSTESFLGHALRTIPVGQREVREAGVGRGRS